jgi:hypothetical protein
MLLGKEIRGTYVVFRTLVPQLLGTNLRYLAKENHLLLRVLDRYLVGHPPTFQHHQQTVLCRNRRTKKDLVMMTR